MRGAKFLGHTAKRRKKTGRCKPSGPLCRFHGELPSGCHCCAALVAPPSLRGSCCAASAGLPPLRGPRCTALVARILLCRIRRAGEHAVSASPLRCAASAGPGSMPVPLPLSASPLRCAARLRCSRCRPVARPRSGWRSRRFRAPSLLHWVAPFVLPLSRRVAPPLSGRGVYRMATCA